MLYIDFTERNWNKKIAFIFLYVIIKLHFKK